MVTPFFLAGFGLGHAVFCHEPGAELLVPFAVVLEEDQIRLVRFAGHVTAEFVHLAYTELEESTSEQFVLIYEASVTSSQSKQSGFVLKLSSKGESDNSETNILFTHVGELRSPKLSLSVNRVQASFSSIRTSLTEFEAGYQHHPKGQTILPFSSICIVMP